MKKFILLIVVSALIVNTCDAAFTESKEGKKDNSNSVKNADIKAAAEFFVTISRKEYEEITDRRLSLLERAAFKIQQKRLKNELQRADGDGISAGGFLAGFLFLLLGVLLVYLLSKDANMRKWAWIGTGVGIALIGILFVFLKSIS